MEKQKCHQPTTSIFSSLRRSLFSCLCFNSAAAEDAAHPSEASPAASTTKVKNRLSANLAEIFSTNPGAVKEDDEIDSFVDVASDRSQYRSIVAGTIYGHRNGHVIFCVQADPSTPPPFLYELSMQTDLLAREMSSGVVRVALEQRKGNRSVGAPSGLWRAYCNGRSAGHAVRRRPMEKDSVVLRTVQSMSAGTGVVSPAEVGASWEEGDLIYMRASYERVVGSPDYVSYHLINPAGDSGQELSFFLLRSCNNP